MQEPIQPVTILKAKAGADMPEIGIKEGDTFYMARDGHTSVKDARFRVVKWDKTRWACSCGKGRCTHKFLVNEYLFNETQAHLQAAGIDNADLFAHVEDDLRSDLL